MQAKPKKTSAAGGHDKVSRASEPEALYTRSMQLPQVKDFTYRDFKKIADQAPFSQAEWAAMLHISERTLQRYAKSNGSFASINAERAMQLQHLLKEARNTFGSTEIFYEWLKSKPPVIGGHLSLSSLTSYSGIEQVLTQLIRIQHGLFA